MIVQNNIAHKNGHKKRENKHMLQDKVGVRKLVHPSFNGNSETFLTIK